MSSFERIASALETIVSNQGQIDPLLFVVPFVSALLGAFTSAWLFHRLALQREARQRKQERSQSLIDQFFSKDFISHRASMYELRSKISADDLTMRAVAVGYVFPIDEECYDGDVRDALTEHEHLELYLGYLQRIAFDISKDLVDVPALQKALSYQFIWHSDFLRSFISECRSIAEEKNTNIPSFCGSVNLVLDSLGIPETKLVSSPPSE